MAERSDRLRPVARVAESKEDKAARELAEAQSHLEEQRRRLADLQQYREEYLGQFGESGRQGLRAEHMRGYQSFIARLNEAVEQQQRFVTLAEQQLGQKRQIWVLARNHSRMVDSVIERYRQQEEQARDRRDQKDMDERAQRMIRNLLGEDG